MEEALKQSTERGVGLIHLPLEPQRRRSNLFGIDWGSAARGRELDDEATGEQSRICDFFISAFIKELTDFTQPTRLPSAPLEFTPPGLRGVLMLRNFSRLAGEMEPSSFPMQDYFSDDPLLVLVMARPQPQARAKMTGDKLSVSS